MASAPSWIILGSVARVSDTDAGPDLPPGADLVLALAAPPRVTLLTVHLRVSPDPDPPQLVSMVLSVDPSGLLFLCTPPAPSPLPTPHNSSPSSPLSGPNSSPLPSPHSSPPSSPHSSQTSSSDGEVTLNITDMAAPGYYVCDASSATATRLPDYRHGFLDDSSAGLIASPAGGGHYMVVELQPLIGSDEATLLCFSSVTGAWEEKDVVYPLPCRIWSTDAVISHGGKLCWVDLSWGILSCDPFADEPVLDFVELPESKLRHDIDCLHCAERDLSTRRCVQVSNGNFCLVELTCGHHRARSGGVVFGPWARRQRTLSPSHRKAPRVVMWRLADPDTGEWKVEHRVNFADIWADDSYKETGLPRKAPKLALLHPKNPDVVYFFLGKHLFGVNLLTKKLVECEVYKLVGPSRRRVCSSSVHAWELPAAPCAIQTVSAVAVIILAVMLHK